MRQNAPTAGASPPIHPALMSQQSERDAAVVRGICTSTRRRVIVAMAALGMLASAAPAEGAKFWTIRPDHSPLLWVGLSDAKIGQYIRPLLAVPTAGAFDQHWSFRKSGHGYKIVNRKSGGCLGGDLARNPGQTYLVRCPPRPNGFAWNFHRPGSGQPVTLLSSGVYQLRESSNYHGELLGRCLVVLYSYFRAGARLAFQPCNRGTANQRFLLRSFTT
jgi:hypothetical protein